MIPVARGDGIDTVYSETGTGPFCAFPLITATDQCSPNVFINNIGSVRIGDIIQPHPFGGCGNDGSPLTTASSNVYVNGRRMGRVGDQYTTDNTITSGSSNVFAN